MNMGNMNHEDQLHICLFPVINLWITAGRIRRKFRERGANKITKLLSSKDIKFSPMLQTLE